jgi:hypothetical protein
VEDGQRLLEGDWIILLHQHGCSTCETAIPRYIDLLPRLQQAGVRLALVEVTQSGDNLYAGSDVWTSHLKPDHEWFASTPIVVWVQNGNVLQVRSGIDAAEASRVLADFGIVR